MSAAVVYIDTENKFSATRLAEIASTRFQQVFRVGMAPDGAAHLTALMRSVLVFREQSSQSLARRLAVLDDVIIEHNVTLVVVDSIASLARKDFGPSEIVARQHLLSEIGACCGAGGAPLCVVWDVFTRRHPVCCSVHPENHRRHARRPCGGHQPSHGHRTQRHGGCRRVGGRRQCRRRGRTGANVREHVGALREHAGECRLPCVPVHGSMLTVTTNALPQIVMETPGKVGAGAGIGIGTGAGAGAGAGAAAGDVGSTPDPSAPLVRQVRVLKSPIAPPVRVPYAITASGIEALQLPGCSF